jgi:hypothetical protein
VEERGGGFEPFSYVSATRAYIASMVNQTV